MTAVGMRGRLLVTPKNPAFAPFEVPADTNKETWFCTAAHDGETFYYTGKTQASAGSSYPASMVTVLSSHTEEYEV